VAVCARGCWPPYVCMEWTKPISERDVAQAVRLIRESRDSSEAPVQFVAEAMTFDFYKEYRDRATGWGACRRPMFTFNGGDGTAGERPGVKRITEGTVRYWTERAGAARQRILRARCADLVKDFQKLPTQQPPHHPLSPYNKGRWRGILYCISSFSLDCYCIKCHSEARSNEESRGWAESVCHYEGSRSYRGRRGNLYSSLDNDFSYF
jgi:hypothetical protein